MKHVKYCTYAFILIMILKTINLQGQSKEWTYGINFSSDLNSYTFVDNSIEVESYRGRMGYSLGFLVQHNTSKRLSLRANFNFSNKNFVQILDMDKYREIHPGDPFLIGMEDIRIIFSSKFIDVPLTALHHFKTSDSFDFYGSLGLVNSFRIGYKRKGGDEFTNPGEMKYNKYLLSTKVGTGFIFKRNNIAIGIEPQIRLYLTEVHERWLTENPIHLGLEVYLLKLK